VYRRISIALAVVLIALATLALAACSSGVSPSSAPAPDAAGGAGAGTAATAAGAASVSAMSIEEKRSQIATNFQMEIPVPKGQVVRGNAQGDRVWDYEIVVDAPQATVFDWYESSFTGRDWQIADVRSSNGVRAYIFTKNRAEMRLTVAPEGSDKSRVKAVIGVGVPILNMQ
jgi:hypothetical protein